VGCDEVIRRIYRATDLCGNEALCAQFISRQEPPPMITLEARVFLQAAMIGDTMEARLNDMGYLPPEQPYTALPFDYWGAEQCASMPTDIVDWILVQLRDVITMEVISQRAALVKESGDIVEIDGASAVTFEAPADWYYIAVRHRNHMSVVTDAPMDCTEGAVEFDFTVEHGANAGMVQIVPGVYAMMCGDVNGDNLIKFNGSDNDKNAILSAVGTLTPNAVLMGYNRYDVNMDGVVKFNGSDNDKNAVLGIVGVLTPNNIVSGPLY
jgi:hypothetical protein